MARKQDSFSLMEGLAGGVPPAILAQRGCRIDQALGEDLIHDLREARQRGTVRWQWMVGGVFHE